MTIFQEQTKTYIQDIAQVLKLNQEITQLAKTLADKKLKHNTKPVTQAAALIYLAGFMKQQYISVKHINREYRYTVKRKRGNIPLPLRVNKIQIITLADHFMKHNFKAMDNGVYNLQEEI